MGLFNMTDKKRKKIENDIKKQYAAFLVNEMSENVQKGTEEILKGVPQIKHATINNASFNQKKGNLFEYIEAVKFNRNAANAGVSTRAVVTADVGRPHDAADIEIVKNGKVIEKVQAKFVSPSSKLSETKLEKSDVKSVFYQAGGQKGHFGKYRGMQRLIRKDDNYNSKGSLLESSKRLSKARADAGGLHSEDYKDVYKNLTDELTSKTDGITSGGTTLEELQKLNENPDKFLKELERQQFATEISTHTIKGAEVGFVTNAVVSGVQNIFSVLSDKKELDEALKDIGVTATKGALRGGFTGTLASLIRIKGKKAGIPVISDNCAATVIAGGVIDSGVAFYAYAKGEISSEELVEEIQNTVVKSASTIYFTKAIGAVPGASSIFLPMAIYSVASYAVAAIRSIIKNAELNAEEYKRIAAMLDENTRLIKEYHNKINNYMTQYEQNQRTAMSKFFESFEYNIETGENYDKAVCSLITFANRAGIILNHVDFNDFKVAMTSDNDFVL